MSSETVDVWTRTSLKEAAGVLFTDGDWVESKDQDPGGEVRLIQLADIGDGAFLDKSARFLSVDKARELRCTFLQPGDLLIARMADPIARCCLFPDIDQLAATVVDVTIVRTGPDVDREYLAYAVSNPVFRSEALGSASGTTRSRISRSNLGMISLPLPPLDEQRRIAEVLRSVDEAIVANKATLDAARRTLEALAIEITAEAPDTRTVADFGRIITGGTPSPKKPEFWDGELPFITPGDLNDECVSVRSAARSLNTAALHGARVLPANSVLVTCIGSTVGKVAISRSKCATNQQINAICCDPDIAGYVYLACLSAREEIIANAGKQAVPIINKRIFSGLNLPFFPRDRMREISEAVDVIDDERKRAGVAADQLVSLKGALMSDLLSGRVRVPS